VTDRTRVGGAGGGNATSIGDRTAEDGFQKALGQSTFAPQPVTGFKPKPKAPPRQGSTPAPAPQPRQTTPQTSRPADAPTPETGRFSSLGDRLVELRKTLGITQVELARRMGSTQPAMARIEKGEMKPNLRTLARYGEAIGQRVEVAFTPVDRARSKSPDSDDALDKVAIDDVPDALAQVRRQLGLTQSQVATAMETSQPVIARLESGEAVPNLRTLERYCEAIGVEPTISFVTIEQVS
jgi:transcriptional regulator with XRE-family HTH domain